MKSVIPYLTFDFMVEKRFYFWFHGGKKILLLISWWQKCLTFDFMVAKRSYFWIHGGKKILLLISWWQKGLTFDFMVASNLLTSFSKSIFCFSNRFFTTSKFFRVSVSCDSCSERSRLSVDRRSHWKITRWMNCVNKIEQGVVLFSSSNEWDILFLSSAQNSFSH